MTGNRVGFRSTLRGAVLTLTVFALTAVGISGTPAASAAPKESDRVSLGMQLAGFNAEVARANGYEIVTLPDGSQASVPASKAGEARAGRYVPTTGVLKSGAGEPAGARDSKSGDSIGANGTGEKVGDCGVSWLQFNGTGGNNKALLLTGFYLTDDDGGPPWDVHWHVYISDNGGDSTQNYNEGQGAISGYAWQSQYRTLTLTRGPAYANVTATSFVITTHGWVCFSAGPRTSTNIR